ncbi:hypothetical protein EMPG_14159 [Blastomyces silverae]|uniref:Uncharacterized protein n=1 Tax=Blastomyces silverae TaxID=2060906 RepID=A0A0H1BMS1_9EURO|nr:hypothetical protein EMPG_14159 [Blastomyces silverae]
MATTKQNHASPGSFVRAKLETKHKYRSSPGREAAELDRIEAWSLVNPPLWLAGDGLAVGGSGPIMIR